MISFVDSSRPNPHLMTSSAVTMALYINIANSQPGAGHLFQIFHAVGTQACLGVWSRAWTNFSVFCTCPTLRALPSLLRSQQPSKSHFSKAEAALSWSWQETCFTQVTHYPQQNKTAIIQHAGYLGSTNNCLLWMGKTNKMKTSKIQKIIAMIGDG